LLSSIQDPSRIAALHEYRAFDAPLGPSVDQILDLARHLFDASAAFVSVLDADAERIEAGRNIERRSFALDQSLGAYALQSEGVLVVEDTGADERFTNNPLVRGEPGIRFYAGAPLVTPEKWTIGTLAVLDTAPQSPSSAAVQQLENLAALVMDGLEHARRARADAPEIILDPTGANTAVLDEDGTILQVNDSWRTFAASNDVVDHSSIEPGTDYLEACEVPSDAPGQRYAEKALSGMKSVLQGTETTFELVYPCHAPTEKRWFRMRVTALDHPQARALVVHSDVTAEKQQRRRRRLLEAAVEQASEVVLITEGTPLGEDEAPITYVNPAIETVAGYAPEEIIGESLHVLLGPATQDWALDALRRHLAQGEPYEGEITSHRKDGTPYVNHWSLSPVRTEADDITHWVALQRDVTEHRKMEKRLLAARERERRRIAETMHDEIGGLLTSLQLTLDVALAQEREVPSSGLQDIESVVQDLSTVVRTLTGRLHSRVLEDYGLQGAIARLVQEVEDETGLAITVHNELSSGERLPRLIEKIAFRGVREALNNVVRHAETDAAQVLVNREPQTLRIHVTDEGVGFHLENQLVENDRYGLLWLRERIERLNGTIEINTQPGTGTRISMILPLTLGPLQGA